MCEQKENVCVSQGGDKTSPCFHVRLHTVAGCRLVKRVQDYAQLRQVYVRTLWTRGITATVLLLMYLGTVLLGDTVPSVLSYLLKFSCTGGLLLQCALLPTGIVSTLEGHLCDITAGELLTQPADQEEY